MLHPRMTLRCGDRLLDVSKPLVMGILNVTPDSFYDGGRYDNVSKALLQVERMLSEGAAIVDIGGMSTRPGAEAVSAEEETARVLPVVEEIHKAFPEVFLSVDTFRASVARAALNAGAHLVNDVTGGSLDAALVPLAAETKAPYVLMHLPEPNTGNPLHPTPNQEVDIVLTVLDYFSARIEQLHAMGVWDIILDPGFGFGKSISQNYRLLANMHVFQVFNLPILTGISRKSMIYKVLGVSPSETLAATTALHLQALQQGSKILRVHDVRAAREAILLFDQLTEATSR